MPRRCRFARQNREQFFTPSSLLVEESNKGIADFPGLLKMADVSDDVAVFHRMTMG